MVEVPFLRSMYLLLVSVVYILQLAYDAVDYLICPITCQSSWQLQTNYLIRNQSRYWLLQDSANLFCFHTYCTDNSIIPLNNAYGFFYISCPNKRRSHRGEREQPCVFAQANQSTRKGPRKGIPKSYCAPDTPLNLLLQPGLNTAKLETIPSSVRGSYHESLGRNCDFLCPDVYARSKKETWRSIQGTFATCIVCCFFVSGPNFPYPRWLGHSFVSLLRTEDGRYPHYSPSWGISETWLLMCALLCDIIHDS